MALAIESSPWGKVEAFDPGPLVALKEDGIKDGFIGRLQGREYEYRPTFTPSSPNAPGAAISQDSAPTNLD